MTDVLLQPLTWGWLGLVVLALRLGWQRLRIDAGLGLSLAAALSCLGGTPLSGWLLAQLEVPYAQATAVEGGTFDAILVLGGGYGLSALEPAGFSAQTAFDRILTAVTMSGNGASKNIVFGGGFRDVNGVREQLGESQARWWRERLPAHVRLEFLADCTTTRDEAVHMAELARREGWTRIALVTSAWHLRRAKAAFAEAGLTVVPVGCDFEGHDRLEKKTRFTVVPTPGDLGLFGRWAHEVVGWWYYRLRGWG